MKLVNWVCVMMYFSCTVTSIPWKRLYERYPLSKDYDSKKQTFNDVVQKRYFRSQNQEKRSNINQMKKEYEKRNTHSDINFTENNKATSTIRDFLAKYYYESGVGIEWSCDACKLIVGLVQTYSQQDKTQDEIASILLEVCVTFQIEDKNVCQGIISLFKLQVLTVVSEVVLSPDEICGFLFGHSCGTVFYPSDMWYLELPDVPKPAVVPPVPPNPGRPTFRVLHLTDIHLDENYIEGAESDCGEPLCCRKGDTVPGDDAAGKWGSFMNCDLPLVTLKNLLEHLNETEKFDYILMTGDIPAHYVWQSTQNDTEHLITYIADLFVKYFPGVPVFPSLGNHEGVPVNSFPPASSVVPPSERVDWLYQLSAKMWQTWLPKDTATTILKGGFYTTLVKPGLRIVSMNMNYCNSKNWWTLLNMTDPMGHLRWLIDTLQAAETNKEKVHIIGHIPPGVPDCVKAWSWNYYTIINRYENTVVAQFFGHLHHDTFEVFYDPSSNFTRATSIAYIGQSVEAASSGNNGYKVYTVDGQYKKTTWMVLDHENYITNLASANSGGCLVWSKIYSAKAAYGLKSLVPSEWDKLIKRMEKDDKLMQRFYKFYYKMEPPSPVCDESCKQNLLCSMKSARSYDPGLCQGLNTTQYTEYVNWLTKTAC